MPIPWSEDACIFGLGTAEEGEEEEDDDEESEFEEENVPSCHSWATSALSKAGEVENDALSQPPQRLAKI